MGGLSKCTLLVDLVLYSPVNQLPPWGLTGDELNRV